MSVTLGDAVLYLATNDSKLKAGLDQAEDKAKSWAGSAGGFIKNAMSFAVGGLIQTGISAITSNIGGLASEMINSNSAFEQYKTRFSVLLGSTDAAQKRMEELAAFGASTPFDLPGVVEADTILQGFGLHSEEAAKKFGFSGKEIRTIAGDVASGTGSSFQEMALLIGKFSSGATGEAISRMQELGITNRDELTKMGLEFEKSGALLTPLPEAMETILGVMKKKYGGLMDAQSKTFDGMMSNLRDWVGNALRTMGQPIFEILKDKLGALLEFLGSPGVQEGIKTFAGFLANALGQVVDFVKNYMMPIFETLFSFLAGGDIQPFFDTLRSLKVPPGIADFITDLVIGLSLLIDAIRSGSLDGLTNFLSEVGFDTPFIQRLVEIIVGQVIPALQTLFSFLTGGDIQPFADTLRSLKVPPGIADFITDLVIGLKLLIDALLSGSLDGLTGFLSEVGFDTPFIQFLAEVIVGQVIPALQQLGTWAIQLAQFVLPLLAAAWDWIGQNMNIVLPILAAIGVVILALTSPISLVIAAIVLLAAAWANNWGGIQQITQAVWDFISPYINQGIAFISTTITTALAYIQDFWNKHGANIMTIVNTYIQFIWGTIQLVLGLIMIFWNNWGQTIITLTTLAWNNITTIVKAAMDILGFIIDAAAALISGDWDAFGAALQGIWNTAWEAIKTILSNAGTALQTVLANLVKIIKGTIWDPFVDGLKQKWDDTWKAIQDVGSGLQAAIQGIVDGVKTKWNEFADGLKQKWDSIWEGIKATVSNALAPIKANLDSIMAWVQGVIDGLLNMIGLGGGSAPAAQSSPGFSASSLVAAGSGSGAVTNNYFSLGLNSYASAGSLAGEFQAAQALLGT